MKPYIKLILYALLSIISILLIIFIIRLVSPREIDDVSPLIQCDPELLEKSDILWIVPKFNNSSLEQYPEWIESIKSLNETLGLHGVYHTYEEFSAPVTSEYLKVGIDEFQKAFGYPPAIFKAPHLKLSKGNKILIEQQEISTKNRLNQIFHKVYHCDDTGTFSNKFIDKF